MFSEMSRVIQILFGKSFSLFTSFFHVKRRIQLFKFRSSKFTNLLVMLEQNQIIDLLTDPTRVTRPIPTLTTEQREALNRVWCWDDEITGTPYFDDPNPNTMWMRRLPPSLLLSSAAQTVARGYVERMTSNEQNFLITCSGGEKRGLLCAILQADIKKIQVHHCIEGLRIQKTNADLMTYEDPPMRPLNYPLQELRSRKPNSPNLPNKTQSDLMTEINLNAARGIYGAGTHQCRQGVCTSSGPCMTQSGYVRWGPQPNQVVTPLRRLRCDANNITYLLFCNACLQMGLWTTYIGETEKSVGVGNHNFNFHTRIAAHIAALSNSFLGSNYRLDVINLRSIAYGLKHLEEPDPDQFLRDPFSHFSAVHTPEDRRYVILDGNYRSAGERKLHEKILMFQFGNFVYDPVTHSGALNHPL